MKKVVIALVSIVIILIIGNIGASYVDGVCADIENLPRAEYLKECKNLKFFEKKQCNEDYLIEKVKCNKDFNVCIKNGFGKYTCSKILRGCFNRISDGKKSCIKDIEKISCYERCRTRADKVCSELYAPVCGSDGKTYSNQCFLGLAFMQKSCDGECPCYNIVSSLQ